MTNNAKSKLLARAGAIVGLVIGAGVVATGIYKGAVWIGSVQTSAVALAEHEELETKIYTRESKEGAKRAHEELQRQMIDVTKAQTEAIKELRDEMKTIRQRTWELLQDSRSRRSP